MADQKIGYRTRSGQRIATEWTAGGMVTVKTFGLDGNTKTQHVTAEQFEDAAVVNGWRQIREHGVDS